MALPLLDLMSPLRGTAAFDPAKQGNPELIRICQERSRRKQATRLGFSLPPADAGPVSLEGAARSCFRATRLHPKQVRLHRKMTLRIGGLGVAGVFPILTLDVSNGRRNYGGDDFLVPLRSRRANPPWRNEAGPAS